MSPDSHSDAPSPSARSAPARPPTRPATAVLLLLLASLVSSSVSLPFALCGKARNGEDVRQAEEHLGRLRPCLPPRGVVGYHHSTGHLVRYYQAQYVLAPLVVVQDREQALVIGDGENPVYPDEGLRRSHPDVLDLGDGLRLYRAPPP